MGKRKHKIAAIHPESSEDQTGKKIDGIGVKGRELPETPTSETSEVGKNDQRVQGVIEALGDCITEYVGNFTAASNGTIRGRKYNSPQR